MLHTPINSFRGEFNFLSNFYPHPIKVCGITYCNVEAAYQAGKSLDGKVRRQFSRLNGAESKKRGRTVKLRPDWDKAKIEVMELCLRAKFSNPKMQKLLLSTGERTLIEGNYWGDTFWGVCKGEGRNTLGTLLMIIRNDLKK